MTETSSDCLSISPLTRRGPPYGAVFFCDRLSEYWRAALSTSTEERLDGHFSNSGAPIRIPLPVWRGQ